MKKKIFCQDKYEAQKLSSLIHPNDKDALITGILNIIENEVIVSLLDKSAHSIILKDSENVDIFADFIQSVLDNEHEITSTKIMGKIVEIEKRRN